MLLQLLTALLKFPIFAEPTLQDTAALQLIYLGLDFSAQQFKVVSHFCIKFLFVSANFCSGFSGRALWDCSFESRQGLDVCPF